ncbi:MAG: hypothetical protein M1833_004471 [Piccolia ochrophora]|nr:MAG: hypothetical protein M1833_004471 [Piccolia ochrophora]
MSLNTLPPELTQEILTYLPIPSLFSYSQTSRRSHVLANSSLRTLGLGIFTSRINAIISSIDSSPAATTHAVRIVLPKRDTQHVSQIVRHQNERAARLVEHHAATIRDLELSVWELERPLTTTLARMPNLRRLALRLDHPHTRHPRLDKAHWSASPPGTVWNALDRHPDTARPVLGRLESLTLERAGITDYQLSRILANNPRITRLRLAKCRTLTEETFECLARSPLARSLEHLEFVKSDSEEIDERVLQWIPHLTALKSLSFHACPHLDSDQIAKLNADVWHIPRVTLPYSADSPLDGGEVSIEVDPEYK